jgi:poly(hydroxyalkanoate) granule-associated protein
MVGVKEVGDLARQIPDDMMEAGRKVWLAGLGAVGMAASRTQELYGGGQELFERLVREGRKLRDRQTKRVGAAMGTAIDATVDTTSTQVTAMTKFLEDNLQSTTKVALNAIGLPSRRDINILTSRLDLLQGKVEALSKKGAARGR